MKKIMMLFLSLVLVALYSCDTYADENQARVTTDFWETLTEKVEKMPLKKNPASMRAIGGVRAAKNRAVEDLYWKDEAAGIAVREDELDKFKSGLRFVKNGRVQKARETFKAFLKEFPDSRLAEDARRAVAQLRIKGAKAGGGN